MVVFSVLRLNSLLRLRVAKLNYSKDTEICDGCCMNNIPRSVLTGQDHLHSLRPMNSADARRSDCSEQTLFNKHTQCYLIHVVLNGTSSDTAHRLNGRCRECSKLR